MEISELGWLQHNKKEDNVKKIGLTLAVFAFLVYWASDGQSQEVSPKVGDNAPDFKLVDVSGNEIRLGDFKGKKNVVLVFYAEHNWGPCREQLGELQEQISEIEKHNAEVIAISTAGGQQDVEKTESSLGITFTLIPMPNRKAVEDFGLKYDSYSAAYATIVIGKKGRIRFKNVDEAFSRTTASKVIKELQGIQWCDISNKVGIIKNEKILRYHLSQHSGSGWR